MPRFLAAAAVLALAVPASAGPLAPSKPSQLVTVRAVSEPCPIKSSPTTTPYQLTSMSSSDGNQAAFAIPPKQVFVITSASLVVTNGDPNETAQLVVFGLNAAGTDGTVFVEGYARTDDNGFATFVQTLPTGIAVKSGVRLCALGTTGSTLGAVTGFFAKDK
jgi:hypothetical protein